MRYIQYQKISGAGNTFIVAHGRDIPSEIEYALLARELCRSVHDHGGADGLIVIDSSSDHDFTMHYYNRDGSTGMMCGNGGRCAVRFAADHGYLSGTDALTFTNAGILYHAAINGEQVRINFPDPRKIELHVQLEIFAEEYTGHYVDVGTPHLLLFSETLGVPSLGDLDIEKWGPAVRSHPFAGPGGANANFMERLPENEGMALRTFERGVEGETGACGTGAIATGIVAAMLYDLPSPVRVLPTSGSPLYIHMSRDEGGIIHDLGLEGGAEVVMEGQFSLADLPALHT